LVNTKINNVSEEAPELKEVKKIATVIVAGWVVQGIVKTLQVRPTAACAVDVAGTATAIGNKPVHLYDQWKTLSPFAKLHLTFKKSRTDIGGRRNWIC